MKETPFPFTVSAMITLGRFSTSSSARNVFSSAATSWPSQRTTCQPNARNFASMSPRLLTLLHPGVGLNLVVIDDGDDLAEAAIRGGRQRLPELPFLQLAVAGEHEDAALGAGEAVGQHHALRLRDAHAQRAGVGLDVWRLDMRVAGQAVQTAKLVQLVLGQQAKADQHVVERWCVVALRREEDVGMLGPLCEIANLVQEYPAHDLERAEARADVAGPRAGDHVERVDARQRREGARPRDVGDVRVEQAVELVNGHELKLERFALVGLYITHVRPS